MFKTSWKIAYNHFPRESSIAYIKLLFNTEFFEGGVYLLQPTILHIILVFRIILIDYSFIYYCVEYLFSFLFILFF